MVHTRFFETELEAEREFESMKSELSGIIPTVALAADPLNEDPKSQAVSEALSQFVRRFPWQLTKALQASAGFPFCFMACKKGYTPDEMLPTRGLAIRPSELQSCVHRSAFFQSTNLCVADRRATPN